MIHVGLGQAEGFDTERIVTEVIADCRNQLETHVPTGGIVFAGPHIDHALMLEMILNAFPDVSLTGCTTAGNFSSFHGVSDDAVSLALFSSANIEFSVGIGNHLSIDYQAAVTEALGSARNSMAGDPSLCLMFPHSYGIAFEPVIELLNAELGPKCPIFGGVAGMLWTEPTEILQFCGREVLTDSLPVLLMSGPVEHRFSIANSWRPIGKRTVVGKSEDRTVYSIGDMSAVGFYRYYLGYHEDPAREFLLAVYEPEGDQYYVCAPIDYHEDESITFTGPIPEHSEVQLTEALREDLIRDTVETSKSLCDGLPSKNPALILNFSCGFRKTILGTDVGQELDAVRNAAPSSLPIMGFFSFGEIAPLIPGGPSKIQGATLVNLSIGPGSGDRSKQAGAEAPYPSSSLASGTRSYEFIERRLKRSEAYRQRLEDLKDFTTQMHYQMMDELDEARQRIVEKEERLRESEEKFRRIVQTAGEGFILMDKSFTIIDANEAYCALTGYARDDIVGKPSLDIILPQERQQVEAIYSGQEEETYKRFEGTIVASDGSPIPVLIHSNPLQSDSGELIGHMAFFADLTEQKKALALAGEVQKNLLPQSNPEIPGLDIAGRNISCEEVGGDYYDFFLQHDRQDHAFSVAVGDITGHGVDAALLMSSARAFLRLHVSKNDSLVEIVEEMNRHLAEDVLETGRFMTLFYLSLNADRKSLEWVRAGHDPAILYDPRSGACEELKGPGVALGVDSRMKYQSTKKGNLIDGHIIAIGTDGIWDTLNQSGEMFGRERVKQLLRDYAHLSAANLLNTIFSELEAFRQGRKSEDDITLVIIKLNSP